MDADFGVGLAVGVRAVECELRDGEAGAECGGDGGGEQESADGHGAAPSRGTLLAGAARISAPPADTGAGTVVRPGASGWNPGRRGEAVQLLLEDGWAAEDAG